MTGPPLEPRSPDRPVRLRTHCNETERPPLLGLITLLGIVGPISWPFIAFGTAGLLSLIAEVLPPPVFEGMGESFLPYESLSLIGIVLFAGLRFGRYWAWIWVQILCAIGFLVIPLAELVRGEIRNVGSDRVPALLFALLWLYVRTKRVRQFCSVGQAIRPESLNAKWPRS